MGLSQSVQDSIAAKLAPFHKDLLLMNKITFTDVTNILEILNSIMEDVSSNECSVVSFSILNPEVANSVVWKLLIRISCVKTRKSSGEVQSKRTLKLHHFLRLYDDTKYQLANLDLPRFTTELFNTEMTASNSDMSLSTCTLPTECPVCWERSPDVVLPCAHAYCEKCITQWNRDCPLCRTKTDIDDSWFYVDIGESSRPEDQAQLANARNRVLIGLADRAGQPT